MTEKEFITFLKQANEMGADPNDVSAALQDHTGQEMHPEEIQALMQHLGGQGGGQGGPAGMEGMEGMPEGGEDQIPPEELAALHQSHPQISEEELAQLAQEIEEYLATQEGGDGAGAPPMGGGMSPGGPGGMPPQKMASDISGAEAIRTAPYIFGFLKGAVENGVHIKEAVDFYGSCLERTNSVIKEAQAYEARVDELAPKVDDATAAYIDSVLKAAEENNVSFEDTMLLLKESGKLDPILENLQKTLK